LLFNHSQIRKACGNFCEGLASDGRGSLHSNA
jgi:hypothetical protein